MKDILRNIEQDITTVEGYIKRLKAVKHMDGATAFAISIYEAMLLELYSHRRAVEYLLKEEADK